VNQSENIETLAAALAKAQGVIANPGFDAVNPHYKNRYATLGAHIEAVRGAFPANGLSVVQAIETPERDRVSLTTRILHSSGQWIESTVSASTGAKVQEIGSTVTYLRRYALAAIVGIVGEEDDDGESDRSTRERAPVARPAAAPAPRPSGGAASLTARLATPPARDKEPTNRIAADAVAPAATETLDASESSMSTRKVGDKKFRIARLGGVECVVLDAEIDAEIVRRKGGRIKVLIEDRGDKTPIVREVLDVAKTSNDFPF
jgi:hypothetical protein